MKLSTLKPVAANAAGIDTFLGYNHNLRIADGEFYDMKNLTGDHYPVLTPRKARGDYHVPGREEPVHSVTGAVSHDSMIYYTAIGGYETGFLLHASVHKDSEGIYVESDIDTYAQRTLIPFGAYILIFPDKKYYNTITEEIGDMEASFHCDTESLQQPINVEVLDEKGREITKLCSSELATGAVDGEVYYNPFDSDAAIKQWNEATQKWVEVSKLYIHIALEGEQEQGVLLAFLDKVEDGDSLTVTASTYYEARGDCNEEFLPLGACVFPETVRKDDEEIRVFSVIDNKAMSQLLSAYVYQWDSIDGSYLISFGLERQVPDMDFVLECNNRLWGCRYGYNRYGEFVNEIYASQPGNFKSWNAFAGISTDSYVASCGPSGDFTGAVNFNGHPLFFKQDHYWLMSGDYPAQYGYRDAPIVGVYGGSGGSLTVINRLAYYHAIDGIRVFDGYDSTNISAALGDARYERATAGTDGDKLYVSMRRYGTEEWSMFVYDTVKGLWHKEDELHAKAFFPNGNRMFVITDDGFILGTDASLMTAEENRAEHDDPAFGEVVEWMAETGNLLTELNFKYLKQLNVRMTVHEGAEVRFLLQYDDCGKWQEVYKQTATAHRFVTVPISPQRCDHLRLRIEGKGKAEIYAITKTYEKGSDV
ncbi:MAG: hypothetical protein IJ465_06405 [Clostridia bacterium]|nr:hypothetical protein [Clostridia bacterium]